MGDRASISFTNGGEESVAFFSHWDGAMLFTRATEYAEELCNEILDAPPKVSYPLHRLEPQTVMLDFIRWYFKDGIAPRISGSYYLGKDDTDGDNSDNGHFQVDLRGTYDILKAARERSALMTATPTPTKTTKKPKKTAAEWKAAKEMAAKITGYGDGSPIWGKTDVTVFTEISAYLKDAKDGTGIYHLPLSAAIELIDELQKREAFKRLAATL